jgi:hypothetical protein
MPTGPHNRFVVGRENWAEQLRQITNDITSTYWSDFRPVSTDELRLLEHDLNRVLPEDFCQFLTTVGVGRFPKPFGGNLYDLTDIRMACHGPLLMQLGSADWATDDAQRRFYISRGRDNPDPTRFTASALSKPGFSLLDVLQIGTDGGCGYHQLYVGTDPRPFGYCLLYDMEVFDKLPSFSEGLFKIVALHWRWHHNVGEFAK